MVENAMEAKVTPDEDAMPPFQFFLKEQDGVQGVKTLGGFLPLGVIKQGAELMGFTVEDAVELLIEADGIRIYGELTPEQAEEL
jgi:hypothetical protein